MDRRVQHHEYVERGITVLADLLDRRGIEIIEHATDIAAAFAADLAGYLEKRLGFFDREERVHVHVGSVESDASGTTIELQWEADDSKRLLPNVTATLRVTAIISSGPAATSEVALDGSFRPPRARRGGVVEHALSRRLVDATLHTFLRHVADQLATLELEP